MPQRPSGTTVRLASARHAPAVPLLADADAYGISRLHALTALLIHSVLRAPQKDSAAFLPRSRGADAVVLDPKRTLDIDTDILVCTLSR